MNDKNTLLGHYDLLIQITKEILSLDFEQLSYAECVESLQLKQIMLREQIDKMWQHASLSARESLRPSIVECAEWEGKVTERLKQYQSSIANAIKEMKNTETARNNYLKNYSQAEGYFVDHHQ